MGNKSSQNDQTGLPVPSAVPTPKPSVSIDLTRTPTILPVRRPSQFIDPYYIASEKVDYKFRFVRGKKLEKFITYIADNDYVGFSQDQEISRNRDLMAMSLFMNRLLLQMMWK